MNESQPEIRFVEIGEGQFWRAVRDPYEGASCVPWDIGELYEIVGINPMAMKHEPLIAFRKLDDPNPKGGFEIKIGNFLKGFEKVTSQHQTPQ